MKMCSWEMMRSDVGGEDSGCLGALKMEHIFPRKAKKLQHFEANAHYFLYKEYVCSGKLESRTRSRVYAMAGVEE